MLRSFSASERPAASTPPSPADLPGAPPPPPPGLPPSPGASPRPPSGDRPACLPILAAMSYYFEASKSLPRRGARRDDHRDSPARPRNRRPPFPGGDALDGGGA